MEKYGPYKAHITKQLPCGAQTYCQQSAMFQCAAQLTPKKDEATPVRTYIPKVNEITRKWYVIDADNVVLGQLAVAAANLLRGKHKPEYTPNEDLGDHVIIINAAKVALSGNKREAKRAYRHSGYPGGLKSVTYGELLDKNPEKAVEKAVRGMVPKTKLGRAQMRKLRVFAGAEHPHEAQQPEPYTITQVTQ